MRKILFVSALLLFAGILTGCNSVYTPNVGKNKQNNYYFTFLGISIESAVAGDGFFVQKDEPSK